MAGAHIFNNHAFGRDAGFRRAPDPKSRRLSFGVALATGALLVATPAMVMAITHSADDPNRTSIAADASLMAFNAPAVEVDGSVLGFKQDGDTISVNVMADDYGRRVFVQNATGELLALPVSPGQATVSTQLPAAFATSEFLTIRVD